MMSQPVKKLVDFLEAGASAKLSEYHREHFSGRLLKRIIESISPLEWDESIPRAIQLHIDPTHIDL